MPDAVLETGNLRYLIEVERSTKTLNAVMAKVENYRQLFSPGRAFGKPAYQQKHKDGLAPKVLFVLDSAARAANVRKLVEEKKLGHGWTIPSLSIATLDEAAAEMRKALGIIGTTQSKPTPSAIFRGEVRAFVEGVFESGLSSLSWPRNWRTVARQVFEPQQWARMEPAIDKQIADAKARRMTELKSKGMA